MKAPMFSDFLSLSLLLFILGLWGVAVLRRNLLMVLVSVEMILLSLNILLVTLSVLFDDLAGQIATLFVLIVAASESALGLAIFVAYYRLTGSISTKVVSYLKG